VNKSIFGILLFITFLSGSLYAKSWAEDVKIKGDFRYRHEMIDQEDKDTRHRHRIRARADVEGKVNEEMKIVLGLSSGSSDPVSNNQTLTDGFSSKGFLIDKAYFEYSPKAAPGLDVVGGKINNPFYKPGSSELLWDSDMRPEGISAEFNHKFENVSVKLIGSGLWIEERKADDDSYLFGGQAAFTYDLEDGKAAFTAGMSYFNYVNTEGFHPFYDEGDSFGNSTNTRYDTVITTVGTLSGTDQTVIDTAIHSSEYYVNDYDLIELYGAVDFKINNVPVTLLGDFVTNTAADSLNSGWLVGLRVGKTKEPGSWGFRYNYREVKKDAVLGIFTDSDFRGGGTNARGHEIGADYQLMEKTTFSVTYFNNQIGFADSLDFHRLQADLKFKF
jgi:hypothetical protein